MKKALKVDCDCGWSIRTPMGEKDLVKHVQMHAKDAHKMVAKRADIIKMAKKVTI